jgi:hypothetical protein
MSHSEIHERVQKIVNDHISDHVEELLSDQNHFHNSNSPKLLQLTFTRYRNVALKHLNKLFVELAPKGVKMADLLHIFVELADEKVLNQKLKPAIYKHYC